MTRNYIDIGPSLQVFKRNKTDAVLLTDEELYRLTLRNIVNTNYKERLWNIRFGGNLYAYLFSMFPTASIESFRVSLSEQIKQNEPNVTLMGVVITPNTDSNIAYIKILYSKSYDNDDGIKIVDVTETVDTSSIYRS